MKIKRKYKRILSVTSVVVVSVVLLMFSSFSTVAAAKVFPEGYEVFKDFSAYWVLGNEYAVETKSTFPISRNYFDSDAPFNSFITQIDDYVQIIVPTGCTVIIQPKIYFTKYDSDGTITAVGDRFVRGRFHYWNGNKEDIIERAFSTRDSTGAYVFNFVLSNTGTADLEFDVFEFGCFEALPEGYSRYYMQVNRIYYDIMPTDIYNQYVRDGQFDDIKNAIDSSTGKITGAIDSGADQIADAIGDSTDKITEGWTPKPQKPAGSGTVDSTNELEDQIGENAQEGIDESNKLLNGFGGTLEILSHGIIFVTGVFNTMIDKMSFFESLAIIGLVLGIIGFILNLVPSIGSRLGRADRDRDRKEKERAKAEKARAKRVAGKNYNNIGNKTRKH